MTHLYKWHIAKLPQAEPAPKLRAVPAGLAHIFHDPRAVGLNQVWVLRLMSTPAPQPTTAEGWLALYLQLRAAVREVFNAF
jgi:hypothetical protein